MKDSKALYAIGWFLLLINGLLAGNFFFEWLWERDIKGFDDGLGIFLVNFITAIIYFILKWSDSHITRGKKGFWNHVFYGDEKIGSISLVLFSLRAHSLNFCA